MSDPETGPAWAPAVISIWYFLGCILLVAVACRDDVGVVLETNPPPVKPDTVFVTDTLIDSIPFPVHDTTYVWCKKVGWEHDREIFECNNGYRGPLF